MKLTTVIINYQTPDLLKTAVTSFKKYYPKVPLLIVDNGSKDNSVDEINKLIELSENVSAHFLDENIFHGPAMDLAAKLLVDTDYIFFLDSDTETLKAGFIEMAIEQLDKKEENIYGVGEFITVNKRGFKSQMGMDILMTPHMFLNRKMYVKLAPFKHHGQPTLDNFKSAYKNGFKLINMPISEYIFHHWRGTANRFGYGLGLKGKIDFILNKLGI